MDTKTRELIKERALSLFPVIRDQITNCYELDPALASAFQFCYLILHGPPRYLEQFKNGNLSIEISDVRDVYMDFSEYVPASYGLLEEEVAIILKHNNACAEYERSRKAVTAYRTNSIGLVQRQYS